MIELTKLPAPAPSEVLLSAKVGVILVLQQTPRDVTVAPPSAVMVPPHLAVVEEISVTSIVVTVGILLADSVGLSSEHDSSNTEAKTANLIMSRTQYTFSPSSYLYGFRNVPYSHPNSNCTPALLKYRIISERSLRSI